MYICFVESAYPVLDHIQTAVLKCMQWNVLSLCICKYLCVLCKPLYKAIPGSLWVTVYVS